MDIYDNLHQEKQHFFQLLQLYIKYLSIITISIKIKNEWIIKNSIDRNEAWRPGKSTTLNVQIPLMFDSIIYGLYRLLVPASYVVRSTIRKEAQRIEATKDF